MATANPKAARPAAAPDDPQAWRRWAPVLVIGVIAGVVGAAVLAGVLAPKDEPRIVERQGGAGPAAGLPADHPPLTIPEQVRQAIAGLEATAAQNPDDVRGWAHLAEVLFRASQIEAAFLDRADDAFARVLELDPDHTDALRGRGNIAYERNRPKEAIGYFERYLAQKPDDLSVQTDLGTMYLSDGQVEQAVRMYDAVLKSDPNFFQAQFNLAIAYRTAGQEEASLAMLEKARDNAPDDDVRQQIEHVIARAKAGPEAQVAGAPPPDLRSSIETIVRTHQILASKVQRFEWQDDTHLRLVLTGFPMAQMPEGMRDIFVSRMQERIAQAKLASGVTHPVTIDFIDFESGEHMDTLVQ